MQPNVSHATATEIALLAAHLSSAARSINATFSDIMPLVFVIDDDVSPASSAAWAVDAVGLRVREGGAI